LFFFLVASFHSDFTYDSRYAWLFEAASFKPTSRSLQSSRNLSLLSGCDEGQLKAAIGERNSVKCALQNRSE
jgi:hypothetical protein